MLEERCDMTFRLRGPIHRETCFIANLYGLAASITEKEKKAKLQAKCDRQPWCPDPFPYVVLSGRLLNPGLFLSFQTPMPCDAVMQIRPQKSNFVKTRMQ